MTHGLHLAAVAITLAGRTLVPTLDLAVAPGTVTTIMGPSGAGKSTLLALVGGFLDPAFSATGRVLIDGADVTDLPPEQRRIGILFQDDLLFPHLSVGGNLAFGLAASVRGRAPRQQRIDAALASAGLAGFAGRDPATLSGGQRARIALLRTLLAEPRALLLDEPFAKLDTSLRQDFRRFVFAHASRRRLPALLVTHDLDDATAAGGPVITLGAAEVALSG
jgi:putative thiamine transport system ATP-binding protein